MRRFSVLAFDLRSFHSFPFSRPLFTPMRGWNKGHVNSRFFLFIRTTFYKHRKGPTCNGTVKISERSEIDRTNRARYFASDRRVHRRTRRESNEEEIKFDAGGGKYSV